MNRPSPEQIQHLKKMYSQIDVTNFHTHNVHTLLAEIDALTAENSKCETARVSWQQEAWLAQGDCIEVKRLLKIAEGGRDQLKESLDKAMSNCREADSDSQEQYEEDAAKIIKLRAALVEIACLDQTKTADDYSGLDEPGSARIAREALT